MREAANVSGFSEDLRDRHANLFDTGLLAQASIGQAGVGRGVGFAELMGSSGIGAMTMFDPQRIGRENVGQSGYLCSEIGMAKVDAVESRLRDINPRIQVDAWASRAEDVPDLAGKIAEMHLLKIGVDNLRTQFALASIAQSVGTDTIVAGTAGDNSQYFIALVYPGGPSLPELLPDAWRGMMEGYRPPEFFPSCRINAESLNVQVARLAIGLLHRRGGSCLPIAEIGRAFIEKPLVIGSNHWHRASGELTPVRFLSAAPRAATANAAE